MKLKIFVFYVSKQALVESFRVINKVNNVEYINDILIQFYELRREKQRRKKRKEEQSVKKQKKIWKFFNIYTVTFVSTVSVILIGFTWKYFSSVKK